MLPQSFFQLKKAQCSINLLPAPPSFMCRRPRVKGGIDYRKAAPSPLSRPRSSGICSFKNTSRFIKFPTSETAAGISLLPCRRHRGVLCPNPSAQLMLSRNKSLCSCCCCVSHPTLHPAPGEFHPVQVPWDFPEQEPPWVLFYPQLFLICRFSSSLEALATGTC